MNADHDKLTRLKTLLAEARDLNRATQVLYWDQHTQMPPLGAPARAEQAATLERLTHEMYTAPEVGRLLEELAQNGHGDDYDSDEASLIRVNWREYQRKRRIPASLVSEIVRAERLAVAAWEKARAASDYELFRPHLERIVGLKRRWAECFEADDIYDPLLQEYEPGVTTAQLRGIFAELKAELVPLVQAIAARADAVDSSCLQRHYDERKQWDLGIEIISRLGFDFEAGRIDTSAHPFTDHFSHADVRLTTRVLPNLLSSALFSSMHEAGHGMYDQGVSPALARTWLDEGTSLGVHESQSRLWENHVGRSRAFWQYWFPRVQALFPDQLADQTAESFYRAVNRVQSSLIRTEADEVTYDLHIMLRVELEQALLEGEVDYAALPEVWNASMREYLGVTPPDAASGVLQDIHWSSGYFGYFATYTLGNLLAAQFFAQARRELPDLEGDIAQGQFAPLLGWLQEKIYRHGRKFTLAELAERVTGGPLSVKPYLAYLREKYGEIYGL